MQCKTDHSSRCIHSLNSSSSSINYNIYALTVSYITGHRILDQTVHVVVEDHERFVLV